MIYLYLVLAYVIGFAIALLCCRIVSHRTLDDKEDIQEQLFFDIIVSFVWLPLLCAFGPLGIIYLIKKACGK